MAIDDVRVISNIATGETGILLANHLAQGKAKVTLIIGPVNVGSINKKIRLINFKFFGELRDIIKKELRTHKYEVIIHSAAVADFKPKHQVKGKISSNHPRVLRLIPLSKIIRDIRRLALSAKLVMFKLECGVSDAILQQRARIAADKFKADLIVTCRLNPYRAFILSKDGKPIFARSKVDLTRKVAKLIITKI